VCAYTYVYIYVPSHQKKGYRSSLNSCLFPFVCAYLYLNTFICVSTHTKQAPAYRYSLNSYSFPSVGICMFVCAHIPLTEEIRPIMFGSRDLTMSLLDLLGRRGFRLHTWKRVRKFRDSRENAFDMYGDSRENLLEILAGVTIWNPTSSVSGMHLLSHPRKHCQPIHL